MQSLAKLLLFFLLFFLSLFSVIHYFEFLTLEKIESWLNLAQQLSPLYVALVVIFLLVLDLFLSIPTLAVTMLAGYFLGHGYGALAALLGLILSGLLGYALSYFWGNTLFKRLIKDENKRQEAISAFESHGIMLIILARCIPMLPEACACIAGLTKMPISKFIFAWLLSAVPYVVLASYAGSISSMANPQPAIYTAIGFLGFLWLVGFFYHRKFRTRSIKAKEFS